MNKQPSFNPLEAMSGQDMMQQLANKLYREGIAEHQPAFPSQHKGEEQPISSPHFPGILQPEFPDSIGNEMSAEHWQTSWGIAPDIAPLSQHSLPEQMLPHMDFYFLKIPEQTEAFISTEKVKDFYSRCYPTQERGKYYFEPMGAEPAFKPANAS
jgi:hypothetical protein